MISFIPYLLHLTSVYCTQIIIIKVIILAQAVRPATRTAAPRLIGPLCAVLQSAECSKRAKLQKRPELSLSNVHSMAQNPLSALENIQFLCIEWVEEDFGAPGQANCTAGTYKRRKSNKPN